MVTTAGNTRCALCLCRRNYTRKTRKHPSWSTKGLFWQNSSFHRSSTFASESDSSAERETNSNCTIKSIKRRLIIATDIAANRHRKWKRLTFGKRRLSGSWFFFEMFYGFNWEWMKWDFRVVARELLSRSLEKLLGFAAIFRLLLEISISFKGILTSNWKRNGSFCKHSRKYSRTRWEIMHRAPKYKQKWNIFTKTFPHFAR